MASQRTFLLLLLTAAGLTVHAVPGCPPLDADQALRLTNSARQQGARCSAHSPWVTAGPVVWSESLEQLAQAQAAWLGEHGTLVHSGPQGQSLMQRAAERGYRPARITENLALGQRDLDSVLRAWAGSETHCKNLVDARVTEMALACVPARDGRPVWVMLKARPR